LKRQPIGEDEVQRMTVTALVDTDSYMLCIKKNMQQQLQLPVVEKRKAL
jgi:hypothetical protein